MKNSGEIKIWQAGVAVNTYWIRVGDIIISEALGVGAVYEKTPMIKAVFPEQKIFLGVYHGPLKVIRLEDITFVTPNIGLLCVAEREYLYDYDRKYKQANELLKTAWLCDFRELLLQIGPLGKWAEQA